MRDKAFPSEKQLRTNLLCHSCEVLFDKNGEKMFFETCLQRDGSFLAFENGLEHMSELVSIGDHKAGYWLSSTLSLSPEKLAYFAVSLFWRTWAAKEKLPGRTISLDMQLDVIDELREFLLGRSPALERSALVVSLIGRFPGSIDLRYTFSLPQENGCHNMGSDVRFYTSECLGFVFWLISAAEPMLTYAKTNCILSNKEHPIFVGEGIQEGSLRRLYAWVGGSTPTDSLKYWRQ